ncbi:MAG: hypothetical protein B7Z60_09870 [Ferrovum sp. 37-45-19]|nr:MAG: hypothetical protein B7Z60_09870 [Ferrovum sp. 37-45-19]
MDHGGLVNRLREILGERKIIHADETPVRQMDPVSGKTKRAYQWAYCSAEWETAPHSGVRLSGEPTGYSRPYLPR